jgi:hypothetical protein
MTDLEINRTADPKFKLLRSLNLPIPDYVIFDSAPLYVYGLRETLRDFDIVARRLT